MSRFLQLHLLTFFPPANLNRDDTGRPKTAVVGGATRLRLSSQALKRAWRTSEIFAAALAGHMGQRTQRLGEVVLEHLRGRGMAEAEALESARDIGGVFGKVKDAKAQPAGATKQLAFVAQTSATLLSSRRRTDACAQRMALELARPTALARGEGDGTMDAKAAGLLRTRRHRRRYRAVRPHAGRRTRLQPRGRRTGRARDHHAQGDRGGRLLHRRR